MSDFDESLFWPEFKAAGFLDIATVTSGGVTKDVDVDFAMPDRERFGSSARSRDYEIEYQFSDLPDLAEGDPVVIKGISYYVRQSPYVPDQGNAASGYFRRALLSKGAGQVIGDFILREDGSFLLREDGSNFLRE